jgi:hypothetical protein
VGVGFIGGQASAAFDLFKLDSGFLPTDITGPLLFNAKKNFVFPGCVITD